TGAASNPESKGLARAYWPENSRNREIRQESKHLSPSHGVRFARLGWSPLSADLALPSWVLGPVLSPPWNLQRPFDREITSCLHGRPLLVFAPHINPLITSG